MPIVIGFVTLVTPVTGGFGGRLASRDSDYTGQVIMADGGMVLV